MRCSASVAFFGSGHLVFCILHKNRRVGYLTIYIASYYSLGGCNFFSLLRFRCPFRILILSQDLMCLAARNVFSFVAYYRLRFKERYDTGTCWLASTSICPRYFLFPIFGPHSLMVLRTGLAIPIRIGEATTGDIVALRNIWHVFVSAPYMSHSGRLEGRMRMSRNITPAGDSLTLRPVVEL